MIILKPVTTVNAWRWWDNLCDAYHWEYVDKDNVEQIMWIGRNNREFTIFTYSVAGFRERTLEPDDFVYKTSIELQNWSEW